MNLDQRIAAVEAACKLFYGSAPTEANANRSIDLLEILRDNPESFWEHYHNEARREAVTQLYFRNYSALRKRASADPSLLTGDVINVLDSVVMRLDEYAGPLDDALFLAWADNIIEPAITRIAAFYTIMRENRRIVYKAIWSVLGRCADLGLSEVTFREIESSTWGKIFERLDDLLIPGTAKLSSRLYALARFETMRWRTDRLRARDRFRTLETFRRREEGCPVRTNPSQVLLDGEQSELSDALEGLEEEDDVSHGISENGLSEAA